MEGTKYKLLQTLGNCGVEHKNEVAEIFRDIADPFSAIGTEYLLISYVKKTFDYFEFTEVPLGKVLCRKKHGPSRIVVEKEESFIYTPILESIQQLLGNKRIASMILKTPTLSSEGVYYDICDGYLYRYDPYFQRHKNGLIIILYHDELEVCNPLGSNAGTHKVDMYYYTIGNLKPKFRSKICAIRLLAIVNAKFVKTCGIQKILDPIIDDPKKLYDGYQIEINGNRFGIFGKVLLCTGDTLDQHLWGGFKEEVGFAFQKCRSCLCNFNEMQQSFDGNDFAMRTKHSYETHCLDIANALN